MTEAGTTVVALWSYGPIEVGEQPKRMHAHLAVEMKHFSMSQLNLKVIKNLFMGSDGLDDLRGVVKLGLGR
jgi:hypothetical protein